MDGPCENRYESTFLIMTDPNKSPLHDVDPAVAVEPVIASARVMIDAAAYEANIRYFAQSMGPSVKVCAVLKADGYGHGLELLAPAAVRGGAQRIGVVDNWEARAVRRFALSVPIMRLRPACVDEIAESTPLGIEEMVGSPAHALAISQLGEQLGCPIPIHLDVDVGMGRTGFAYASASDELRSIVAMPGLRIVGLMTHFPVADADPERTQAQLAAFQRCVDRLLHDAGFAHAKRPLLHTAGSAAALTCAASRLDMVRIGIASYGVAPAADFDLPPALRPVMSWHTRIASVRDLPAGATVGYGMTYTAKHPQRIATLPIGYADGFWRHLSQSPHAHVLIGGQPCPVVGRISMNMTTVDVTHVPVVQDGDDVVLLGQQGSHRIRVEDLSVWGHTIGHEVTCAIGAATHLRVAPISLASP